MILVQALEYCYIGTNVDAVKGSDQQPCNQSSFYGQMGAICFFDEALASNQIEVLHSSGPDFDACQHVDEYVKILKITSLHWIHPCQHTVNNTIFC